MISSIKTDTGRVRSNNEDAFYFPQGKNDSPPLFIVADGMGGHQGGEIASQIAVEEVSSYITSNFSSNNLCKNQLKTLLKTSLERANKKIFDLSRENPDWAGMGTTLTLALFWDRVLYIGHVGDSRAYRIRNNHIEQLTTDHSLVQELVEQGRLTKEEIKTHPMKNVITRAIGTDEDLEPDFLEFNLEDDDIIILCSDGLSNLIDDENIKSIVCNFSPEESTEKLIEKANILGGEDNITVGVIKVGKVGLGEL